MPTSHGSLLYVGRRAGGRGLDPRRPACGPPGAIPVGKTAAPEFGTIQFTRSKALGVTRNPWDLTRTPGGSSGGSAAAVAAGLVPFCTGSDGGGSTRIPAGVHRAGGHEAEPRPHPRPEPPTRRRPRSTASRSRPCATPPATST